MTELEYNVMLMEFILEDFLQIKDFTSHQDIEIAVDQPYNEWEF